MAQIFTEFVPHSFSYNYWSTDDINLKPSRMMPVSQLNQEVLPHPPITQPGKQNSPQNGAYSQHYFELAGLFWVRVASNAFNTQNLRPRRSQKALWWMPLGLRSKTITRNIWNDMNKSSCNYFCMYFGQTQTLVKPLVTPFSTQTSWNTSNRPPNVRKLDPSFHACRHYAATTVF